MWGILIAFVAGIAYGWLKPGKQDKSEMAKRGILWGVIIAAVVAMLGFFFGLNPLGLGDVGFFSLVISFIVLIVSFIVGVWIGDMLSARGQTGRVRRV